MKDLELCDCFPAETDVSTGQLPTSGSLYNTVFLLLFGKKSILNEFTEYSLDSKILDLQQEPLTNKTRLKIKAEAERVLAVLVSKGIAESVTVEAEIHSPGVLYLAVEIEQPENKLVYQLNWGETAV